MDVSKAIDIISDEIIKTVEHYFKKRTRYVHCLVTSEVNKDGTYDVRYDKQIYKTKVLNGITLSTGDTVIMVIPDNKIANRFILGKI